MSGGASADGLLPQATAQSLIAVLDAAGQDPLAALRQTPDAIVGRALRTRVDLLRDAVLSDLPSDYPAFARRIRTAAEDPALTGWMLWPVTEAVALRALEAEVGTRGFRDGLDLLAELTPRLTSEFALRYLLRADHSAVLEVAQHWATSSDAAVRRLASEGTRPLLPWAGRVPALLAEPALTAPILDLLHRDDSDVVRRSVANHLNDISRLDSGLATDVAGRFLTGSGSDAATARLVRHGLRTLVKKGDRVALSLLGFGEAADVHVEGPELSETSVALGEALEFRVHLHNRGDRAEKVVVDYVIHHRKANGSLAPKVFKLSTRTLAPGESMDLVRRHSFAAITTRRYHPGPHAVALQVNGIEHGRRSFLLTEEPDPVRT